MKNSLLKRLALTILKIKIYGGYYYSLWHTHEYPIGEDKRGRRNRFVLVAIAFFLCFQKKW
ncbi:hypothetical protein SPIROBIBN47_50095 [uncultured spirochete]|uniref:Uncharacterized protein n=1 Tax=uncultured spirochete TaxID=156406 RepID=A0A3P3XMR3_9SPIR|nr:hypothetical protein SPIROBIBN47_50095 [uncultured spirochete]